MGQETILEFISKDFDDNDEYKFEIINKWCMCGGCEDFELVITDLETNKSITIEQYSYPEIENGYEISNLAHTVKTLAEEIVRLNAEIEELHADIRLRESHYEDWR